MIGIISAMELELKGLTRRLTDRKTETLAAVTYDTGKLEGKPVVICNCGVGKVNAAMHTQLLITKYRPDVIIQSGIAGSLSPKVKHFDLVIGEELVYHDMQPFVLEQFEPLEKVYVSDARLVRLAEEAAGICHVGRIASGDQFISDAGIKADIAGRTGALCTEMEGCAVAHTAYLNEVPFLVMRAISDMADDSAEGEFDEFQQKAADRAVDIVLKLVRKI
ncbi:MAG TPA: 5'-methylthioadenosine/adenosylhomocysteine nucleosidase [Lachnospiraceae bacterium]|nr:5'-methylthioadenosine/adenosylhomocysteine nucleosidase [Lachnospiraceae bacterium]